MININELLEKASQALSRGDFAQAESSCNQVLMVNPNNSTGLHILGIIYDRQGKTEEAINFISKAIKNAPKNYIFYTSLGEMLRRRGKLKEAEDNFRKAIKLNP